jgi:sarcosine oxidase, subunit gamma
MADAALTLGEVAVAAQLGLRGDAGDKRFVERVAGVLGVAPPTAPNTAAGAGSVALLWLSPDEWLVTAKEAPGELAGRLRGALAGQHVAVVDLSASRVVFELAGPRARDVLAKGCGLDLHPRAFGPGRCAQTALARAAVILHLADETPRYRIFVRRSFARYLEAWLRDAAEEFAAPTP